MQERRVAPPLSSRSGVGRLLETRALRVAATAAVVVVVDQLTKSWALRHLAHRDIHLVWTLRLRLVYNTGGAFSLGGGNPWLFAAAAVGVVTMLAVLGRRITAPPALLALGLVLGGALGNLADRVLRDTAGAVVDFIDLRWWPVFNVADASIVCGAILLLFTVERASTRSG